MSEARVDPRSEEAIKEVADEEIARAAATGDERAFATLVGRYSSRLFTLAYRFLRDRDEAEDAVQEVFIKVYRALPRSRLDLPFKPWIYRIATNECINRTKKRRESVANVAEALESVPDREAGPADQVIEREFLRILDGAIKSLPERYRPVVILRYSQGLSFKEIGEVLKMPEGTAKTFFFRAKEQLKKELRIESGQPD